MGKLLSPLLIWVIKQLMGSAGLDANDLKISDANMQMMNSIWDYFALLGIGFSIIYFLMEINRKYAFEATDLTIKTFAVPFIKLVAAIAVLSNGATLIGALIGIGNNFIDHAYNNFNPAEKGFEELETLINMLDKIMAGTGFFVALILVIPCLICWAITVVCQLVWKYKALGFKIELLFRVGISPVALADIYSGENSQGVRWCKSLFATILYGASFIVIYRLGHALVLSKFADALSHGLLVFHSDLLCFLLATSYHVSPGCAIIRCFILQKSYQPMVECFSTAPYFGHAVQRSVVEAGDQILLPAGHCGRSFP